MQIFMTLIVFIIIMKFIMIYAKNREKKNREKR